MTMGKKILQQMPAVSKPQATFLATWFATILALRGRVTFRNLCRSCDYGERTIARQFRRGFDWPDFHPRGIPVALDPCSDVISAQEAPFLPKRGKQTFGLGHFFNGCTARAERGLEVATLAVMEVTRRCAFTLAVAQTPPGDEETVSASAKEETSGDVSLQQRRAQRHRLPPQVPSHGVDGSFATQQSLEEVVRLNLHPIPKLRCDADCRLLSTGPHPKRRGARRKDDGNVTCQDLRRFTALGSMAAAAHGPRYTAVVWHVALKRTLRLVVVGNRHAPAKPRYIVLASTDLALDGRKLVELYGARVQIAFLCRDRQQFPGLRDCQARAEAAREVHCNAALATLNLARTAQLVAQTCASPQVFSRASWTQRQFHERLGDGFIEKFALEPSWVKTHPSYDERRAYGAIAA